MGRFVHGLLNTLGALSVACLLAPPLAQPLATPQSGGDGHEPAPPADAALDPLTQITSTEVREHVEVLATDQYEGREAGTAGERRAAGYLVAVLEEHPALRPAGEEGGWFQSFELNVAGKLATARNVIASLPGTDPELHGEVIVVGAHYDHVGYGHEGNALDGAGEIHNGADDNASGSAVVLDLATSLAGAGWKPRRTILFQWYSGEERGLLGSKHYVEHPLRPIEQTVFMINMDMIGRMVARTLVVGGTGTSPGLSELARGFCGELELKMIDDPPGTAPSDNTSFYNQGVPALFLFTGLHEDYHAATDDSWKINDEGAADVGRLAEKLLRSIDARDERPAFTAAPGTAYLFRPALYTGAAFVEAEDGRPRVAVVIPDSPAETAGLREGQLVLSLNGEPIADLRTLESRIAAQLAHPEPLSFEVRPAPAAGAGAGEAEAGGEAAEATLTIVVTPLVR